MEREMGFEAAALCTDTGNGDRWEVFCTKCKVSIGTMRLADITRAIIATLGRGGVLCPGCRSVTCDSCGQTGRAVKHEKKEDGTDILICLKCIVQLREVGFLREAEAGPSIPLSMPL